jgi:putative endopeptidase
MKHNHRVTNKNKLERNKNNCKTKKRKRTRKMPELKENFYYYINHKWKSNNFISEKEAIKSRFTILQKKVVNELYKCITHYIFKENNKVACQCKNLYSSLTNWNDKLVETQIYLFMKQINDYRKDPSNLYSFLKWSIYNGLMGPINFGMITDLKKSKHQLATITESGLSFSVRDVYFKKTKEIVEVREYYIKFVQDIFDLFFGKNNAYLAKDVLDIETELATKMYTTADYNDLNKIYNVYTNKVAKRTCDFDLKLFLKEFEMSHVHHVNFINPGYVKHSMSLMKKEWTSEKWNSYWIFKLLSSAANYHSHMHKCFFDFFSRKMMGINKEEMRPKIATAIISGVMNSAVSKMYIRHYKNTPEIQYARNLTNSIIKVFKERLTKNAWLSQPTKEMALHKVNHLICVIGYKDKYQDDPSCDFLCDDAFGNNMKYVNWLYDKYKSEVDKPFLKDDVWFRPEEMNVFDVNAFYNVSRNEIILPNAILQPPLLDLSKNISYNLANIGFIIAHEIIHSLDANGSLFDETGVLKSWWKKEDIENYRLLQEDVKEHYVALANKDGLQINASVTLNENIADISAMNLIETVLENYLFENNIFGEKQNEYFKDLYFNYAEQWRSITTSKYQKNMVLLDQHSLAKYRVNCVLMRSKRFSNVFNITQKDGMFFSENIKEIW